IDAYEALERDAPRSPLTAEAKLHKSEVLLKLDRRDEGEAVLKTLAANAPANLAAQAAYALGGSLLERGKAAEAREVWDDALTRFAGSSLVPMLLYRSAQALELEQKPDEARARYKKLADESPKDLWADDALLRAATLALDGGALAETRTLAARLASQYPKSRLLAEARVLDARAALAEGKANEAIQELTSVLALDPPATPQTAWSARYYLGLAYRADGQGDKSVSILNELSNSPAAPLAASARFVLGQAHFEAKRYADAIPPLETYLAAKPVDPAVATALAYLALAHHHLGQNEAAQAALDRLSAEFPKSQALTRTRYNLAEDALADKDFPKAADLFRLAADGADLADRVKALSGLGWSLLQAKQPVEAADAFAELLKADPDGPLAPDAALARAHALDAANDPNGAIQTYEHVIEKYTKTDQSGPAMLARARLLVRLDRPEEAADAFGRYLDDHPEAGEGSDAPDSLRIEWGTALLDAGKSDAATEVFTRVLTDHPDGPKADEARLNLANLAFNAKEYAKVAPLLAPLVADGSKADPTLIPFALFRMAQTRVEQAEWPAAAPLFARIVAEYPKFPYVQDARFWSAEADYQGGDADRAEPLFSAYIADPPPGPEAAEWVLTAKLRQLQCLVMLARWRDALAAADALKADAPDSLRIEWGTALLDAGKSDAATEVFTR
ncbi:MAG: tetratricopeptide repeat protein, partial [Isosphaeraceae bacterium]